MFASLALGHLPVPLSVGRTTLPPKGTADLVDERQFESDALRVQILSPNHRTGGDIEMDDCSSFVTEDDRGVEQQCRERLGGLRRCYHREAA